MTQPSICFLISLEEMLCQVACGPLEAAHIYVFLPACDVWTAFMLYQERQDWLGAASNLSSAASCRGERVPSLGRSTECLGRWLVFAELSSQQSRGGLRFRAGHLPAAPQGACLSRDHSFSSSRFCFQILHYKVSRATCLYVCVQPLVYLYGKLFDAGCCEFPCCSLQTWFDSILFQGWECLTAELQAPEVVAVLRPQAGSQPGGTQLKCEFWKPEAPPGYFAAYLG